MGAFLGQAVIRQIRWLKVLFSDSTANVGFQCKVAPRNKAVVYEMKFSANCLYFAILTGTTLATSAQSTAVAQRTLNPLPSSVNIPASYFRGTHIGTQTAPNFASVQYFASGDLNGDGYPEVIVTGWSFRGFDIGGDPAPSPLYLFSTNVQGTSILDPLRVLGVDSVAGTSTPRILDINRDGRNDFLYLGHNESPLAPTRSERFLQNANGTFSVAPIAGPKLEGHNSNVGDFNGDGYVDIITSSYRTEDGYWANKINPTTVTGMPPDNRWGYLTLYLNDRNGGFNPVPFVARRNATQLMMLGSGSCAAMADLDGDGKMEFVIVDAFQDLNNYSRGENFILKNIEIVDGLGRGDVVALPTPYFDRDDSYTSLKSFAPSKSHNIHAEILDVNNDGRPDIVISEIVWEPSIGTQAGVFQVLLNQGNLKFVDATDSSIYNWYLGTNSSHQPIFKDINGDGFVDIISPESYGSAASLGDTTWSTKPQMWSNRILIGTGTGKFVQAMWNELRELTVGMKTMVNDPRMSQYDEKHAIYFLPDGRMGFIASQGTYSTASGSYVPQTAWFDYRATRRLSTGPNGSDPAAQGAPGFSEYFYLTQYPDVAAAVSSGRYTSGLAHYLAEGRARGLDAFAPNARINGSSGTDTLTLPGRRNDFQVAPQGGDRYSVTDTTGRLGRLELTSIEHVQFSDQLLDLAGLPSVWLSNLSVRTSLAAAQTVIVGLSTQGGAKPLLVRAVGPTLGQFGLPGAMPDPRMQLYNGSSKVGENDDWNANISATFASVGAFKLTPGSKDSALIANVDGSASVQTSGPAGGVVLVEVYDVLPGNSQRLVNLSARNRVGTGADALIAGFSVSGAGTKRLLIRAIGPTLGAFGVPGVLADPKLEVYEGSTKVAENDNWEAGLAGSFGGVGAFGLTPNSRDSALIVTVRANQSYTVQVSGADGGTGEALVEVYELP